MFLSAEATLKLLSRSQEAYLLPGRWVPAEDHSAGRGSAGGCVGQLRTRTSVAALLELHQRLGNIPAPPCGKVHKPAQGKTKCQPHTALTVFPVFQTLGHGSASGMDVLLCSRRRIPSILVSLPTVKLSSLEAWSTRPGALRKSTGKSNNLRKSTVCVCVVFCGSRQ